MKDWLFSMLGIAAFCCLSFQQQRIDYAENQQKLSQIQNGLLKDQINDLQFSLSSKRTYEEGLTDGLVRAKNIGYTDGYHSAIQQIEEQNSKPFPTQDLTSSIQNP